MQKKKRFLLSFTLQKTDLYKVTSQSGFTFIEIIIVIGIILLIMGFASFNLTHVQQTTTVSATIDSLTAELASQQTKAMVGASDTGVASEAFGIYFQQDRYTLFHGQSYSSSDPSNFTIVLDSPIILSSINVPNNTIVFSSLSGEVMNFIGGENTITVKNTTGLEEKTITFNKYGVITGVN